MMMMMRQMIRIDSDYWRTFSYHRNQHFNDFDKIYSPKKLYSMTMMIKQSCKTFNKLFFIMMILSLALQCNTHPIDSNQNTTTTATLKIDSNITTTTTTTMSIKRQPPTQPSYTFNDYNQAIKQHAFNSPHCKCNYNNNNLTLNSDFCCCFFDSILW